MTRSWLFSFSWEDLLIHFKFTSERLQNSRESGWKSFVAIVSLLVLCATNMKNIYRYRYICCLQSRKFPLLNNRRSNSCQHAFTKKLVVAVVLLTSEKDLKICEFYFYFRFVCGDRIRYFIGTTESFPEPNHVFLCLNSTGKLLRI